jgi:transmembrane sensor
MSNDRLLELITRKLSGEATAEELEEVESMLSVDPEAASRTKLIEQYWDQHENANQFFVEEAFEKIVNRLEMPAPGSVVDMRPSKKRSIKRILQVAAAAAIILVAGVVIFTRSDDRNDKLTRQQPVLIQQQNPKGIKRALTLADGTKIWLNADSKLRYPGEFTGTTREVYLNGEAFFDVAKNPSMPFIIHLSNGTVKVLGTSFNVRAYDNEKIIETSVASGSVAFIPKYEKTRKKQDTVFLSPDNKVRYLFTKEEVIIESTDSREDKAWIAGKMAFKDFTFEEIAVQLERSFGKKIVFVSDAARSYRLTGSFQDNSLEEIFFYLRKSKAFNYKITEAEVLISDEATKLPD